MEKIFIWGTGHIAKMILQQMDIFENYDVLGFVDNSKEKQGTIFYDRMIYSPEMIKGMNFDKIIVLTSYFQEINMQIQTLFNGKKVCVEDRDYFNKKRLWERYYDSKDPEILEIMEYIKTHKLSVFNYDFVDKYLNMDVNLFFDTTCEMYYTLHYGKKMYFSKEFDTYEKAATYYKSILLEQDEMSPHKYLSLEFDVCEGDVVLDVGVAEGNFSLEIVDKVKKIYMIETNDGWIEALRKTFQDYKDKIVIINKFATSFKEGKYITLDSIIEEPVNFIKMDIEGNEWYALQGAEQLIKKSKDLKCAICSYHREYDEILIKNILGRYGMKCSTTRGYMWYVERSIDCMNTQTRFCKAIVRGEKYESNSDVPSTIS